ncbi:MAG: phosphoglucosamine mutase [Candidatus Dadabacteria bacterium]|nr:MAG: phosphoglucosamine mutase [Candidatus Dadabacteria bacterium]
MNKRYFGTDGIRGVANTPPLESESLVRLGRAVASIFLSEKSKRKKHRVLIGKDTRLSGYMIETALASGITSMGCDVLLVGPIPTPGVAYLTRSMRADAGIMISASHNPYEDNGIKIFAADGYKLPDELELQIEKLMQPDALEERALPADIGKATRIDDAIGRYTVYLKGCFPREYLLEGLKVGFDCANGAGYIVGPQTCVELGADVISRGTSPNGRNINAGFGSLYPEIVCELVKENNLNIGISLDGDADRAIFSDEKGNIIDGDAVLAMCAIDLKEQGLLRNNIVVATVMSNLGLERALEPFGISVKRVQVGDRYVLEEMRRIGAQLGGEQSGHTIFSDYATTGDGILTALQVMAYMCRTEKPLSELASVFKRLPQKLVNVRVKAKPPLESVEAIQTVIEKKQKELGSSGRLLVRYSGTEDKARVMVECEDQKACDKHARDVADVIEKEIGSV